VATAETVTAHGTVQLAVVMTHAWDGASYIKRLGRQLSVNVGNWLRLLKNSY
jgi:hypothetical protein